MNKTIATVAVSALALSAAAQGQAAAAPRPTGTIACNRGGQILLLDAATGEQTVLVAKNRYDRPLAWTSGGYRLLYWNHDGGAWDIWAIDPGSKEAANLTRSNNDSRSAVSAPDGRAIAFQRGGQGVWIMDPDGGNCRQVHQRGYRDAAPAWSPSGQQLAFTDLDGSELVTHVIALDGSEPMASHCLGRGAVAFFVDEQQLVVSAQHDGAPELVCIDVVTNERRALTKSPASDDNAVLAPDGRRIAWIEQARQATRLKIMNVDGSDVRDLAGVERYYAPPSFSPDGRFLAFESAAKGKDYQVWIVSVANGPARALTTAGGSFPVWRPR